MEERPYVSWELMDRFLTDVFVGYGVPREDAAICADVLLESDRRGIESHGCNRFKPIYIDRIVNGTLKPVTEIEILKETPTTVVMDAHDGMGMVASYKMMEMLIEKAKTYGMAGGAICNSTHYGIAGYWTTMAEKAGMIGISGTNARPSVAPTWGVEPMLGTNPLTFTMPFPDAAKAGGAKVVATGRSDFPNQVNNVLAFPGVFRGAFDVRASDINEQMKMAAANALASLISAEELTADYMIPQAFDKRVGPAVAKAVAEAARKSGVARQ